MSAPETAQRLLSKYVQARDHASDDYEYRQEHTPVEYADSLKRSAEAREELLRYIAELERQLDAAKDQIYEMEKDLLASKAAQIRYAQQLADAREELRNFKRNL